VEDVATSVNWDTLRVKARELLESRLRSSGPEFTYTEFRNLLERRTGQYFGVRDKQFHKLLCDVCRETEKEGKGLISVIVVHAGPDKLPGSEFFLLAEELGRNVVDHRQFWDKENQRVRENYRPQTIA
jgi:hypothetical protein